MRAFANNMLINFAQADKTAVEKLIHELPTGYRSLGCLAIFAIKRYNGAKPKLGLTLLFGHTICMNVQHVRIIYGRAW